MTIIRNFHEGTRSEYLAVYFLSKIGLVVPVPRQSDYFGVDFIVHLIEERQGNFIPTGKSFAVQVKSNNQPILYTGDQLSCLWAMGLPFFIAVVSRNGLELSIYPTLARLNFKWMIGENQEFSLHPRGTVDDLHAQQWEDCIVCTGPEAAKLKAEDLDNPTTESNVRETFYKVMRAWIKKPLI